MTQNMVLLPASELSAAISEAVRLGIEKALPARPIEKQTKEDYGTRKEISEALKISLPTLNELTKNGTLRGYRIGGRVLYKWAEVELSLTAMQADKYKRR